MSQTKKIITSPLSGFMELLPEEQMLFKKISDVIRSTYENFGFIPLDTPILERAEVLLAKAGDETEKQIYKFKKGNTDLAMRFDLTVPLARYVSEYYGKLTFPFRRYAIGKVYRGEKPQAGRFREFYQCDIDVIGDTKLDIRFDAEIPSIIYNIFRKLGFENFTIRINNRKIFNGLFAELELSKNASQIMQIIDQLEKVGIEIVKERLGNLSISLDTINKILNFIGINGSSQKVLADLKKMEINNDQFQEGVKELEKVVSLIQQFGVPESNFAIDLTIARGLDYYTGTVYETQLDDYPNIGSVCSGGRYDNLADYYTNRKLPGVGISIGLTRLFDQLYKRDIFKTEKSTPTKVLILPMTENIEVSLQLATKLRENNIATEISFSKGKMKKRLNYVNKLNIPYVIFIGEDEIQSKYYTLKNFITGNQEKLDEIGLLSKLK